MGKPRKHPEVPIDTNGVKLPYFLSYSTGEAHIKLFTECLDIVFGNYFARQSTPEMLQTDKSQHDAIVHSIQTCAFGVVCLDGLRPNVIFEYGAMRGANIPVLLFKEEDARVDVRHFFDAAGLVLPESPSIAVDQHFSDAKDRFYASWNRFEIATTVGTIWQEYSKKKADIPRFKEIPEPKL
jgi:hypothetical protein